MNSTCRKLSALGVALGLMAIAMAALADNPPASTAGSAGTPPAAAPRGEGPAAERPGPHGPHEAKPLTQDQINDVLTVLRKQDPELAQRVEYALKVHPERLRQLLAPHWPGIDRLVQLKKNDPALFNMTMEEIRLNRSKMATVQELCAAIKSQDGVKEAQLRQQLHQQVAQQFDVRQQIRNRELDNLTRRLANLKKEFQARQDSREQVIDDHIADLIAQAQGAKPAASPHAATQPAF